MPPASVNPNDPRNPLPDSAEQRAYWTREMNAAYAMMETAVDWPVTESGEPLVSLVEVAAGEPDLDVRFGDKHAATTAGVRRMHRRQCAMATLSY